MSPVIRRVAWLGIGVFASVAIFLLKPVLAAPPTIAPPIETTDGASNEASKDEVAAAGPSEPLYVRVHSVDGKLSALQTATVRFVGKPNSPYAGRIVDLVGVVHIGQAEYYQQLDDQLASYEKVLYELVAPDGTRIRPEDLQARRSLLASVQTGMKDMLNLEYQLERIDYLATNFRHADMSPDEFVADLERRGDSVWKMVARMMGAGLASQAQTGGDAGLLMALFSRDRPKMMKQAMAKQLVDMELITAGINDESGDNTLIKGRNRKAFEVLREELDAGGRKLAVFYGAGHLNDMAERLESDFQMQRGETTWLDAWDLTRN
ncbi:MAG: hypothetical protein AAF670_10950 [Planctomycetota bacterium]